MLRIQPFVLSVALLTLFVSFGVAERVYAAPAGNATYYKTQINYRKALPRNRYEFNKRGIERMLIQRADTSTGSLDTFRAREADFRNQYLKRLKDELEDRKFSGVSRDKSSSQERAEFLREQQLRRVNERIEERKFGPYRDTYLPGRATRIQDIDVPELIERRQRQLHIRIQFKDGEEEYFQNREYPRTCVGLSRSRFSRCLYEQQKN